MDRYTLKSVSDLPPLFRSIFSFRYFNSLQSECFPVCFHSDVNMVISAPTGSGKTVLFELCILRLLSRFISEGKLVHAKGTLKTIYVAPSKALVQEKLREWNQKFGSLGIDCLELTGDNEFYSRRTIQEADLILTTPEKFDAVTRYRINDGGLSFFGDIALLLIDEVHLLNDPRGAALEAIVSRIKMLARNPEMSSCPISSIRILAISATIPNIEDLAEWLNVPVQGIKRFGEEMRPVKLTTKVFGYAAAKNDFLFEKQVQRNPGDQHWFIHQYSDLVFHLSHVQRLQNYVFDLLMQFSAGKSALVFCTTRKGAQEAAQRLSQTAMTLGYSNPFIKDNEQLERLREASLSCSDKQMQSFAFHNGGLCLKDRNLVEGLFLKGDIQVLCTTNTLAHGINLPAHTVVIKSTQHFNKEKGLYTEIDRSTILQMCGRAGRPPFDDTGLVIIMTRRETVHLYENLLNGCEMVESQLLSCITEHLTAEIVQLTVTDIARAIEWIKCSYLYVRIKKNPWNYGVKKQISRDHIEKHVQEISVQKVNELSRYQMIWSDGDGFLLKPLEPGRLMTKYYLKFDTMKYIMQIPESCSLEDALKVVCRAEEISWIQLRRNEKKILNNINADKDGRLRFHTNDDKGKRKKRIQTREEKIFVLANDCLTGDPSVHDLSLTQDMNSICSNGSRIAKCMKEYFIFKKNYKGAVNATLLAKSLYQKLWDDSPYLLKQLPGIGMVTAKALQSMGVKSFDELAEADPRRIEIVTGRKFPFGNQIKESLFSLPPKVNISIKEIDNHGKGKSKLVVTLTRITEATQSTKRHYADIIIGTEEDNHIQFHEKIRVSDFSSPYSITILVPCPQQGKLTVKADLFLEEYVGLDVEQKLILMTKANSVMDPKRGNRNSSSFPPPNDVCVIEDDSDTNHASIDTNFLESASKIPSVPSFNLIDEELGEGETAVEIEKDNHKIISEKTIFDHIREKAKNFPAVTTPTIASPVEGFLLRRKRRHDDIVELDGELIVLDEAEGGKSPQQITSGTKEIEDIEHDFNGHLNMKQQTSSGASSTTNFWDDTGGFLFESEDLMLKNINEETIFDHIRKKAEKFPVLSRPTMPESLTGTPEQYSRNQPEFRNASRKISEEMRSNVITKDANTCSSSETAVGDTHAHGYMAEVKGAEDVFSQSPCKPCGSLTAPPKISIINTSPPPLKMLSFDVSMMKDSTRLSEPGRYKEFMGQQCATSEYVQKKQQPSSTESNWQCCSIAVASKPKEVDSFLGFKSVFSFL